MCTRSQQGQPTGGRSDGRLPWLAAAAATAAAASQLYEHRVRASTRVERQRASRPGGPHGLS
eukprot:71171-Chlamydomonas_euryale.AAC.2